jgi:hypothetical protein
VFKSFGGLVSWKSRRQPTVALSTTEAEYMATTEAAKEAIWLKQLFTDLGFFIGGSISLLNDNTGCIALSADPVHHERTKHIGFRHHFIREKVKDKTICLQHMPTDRNIADLLTKALTRASFSSLRNMMGVSGSGTALRVGVLE